MSRIDWHFFAIVMCAFVIVAMVIDATCHAQEAPPQQYLEFPDFTGGLNLSHIGKIQPNQCLELSNFLIDNGEIRVRDGFGHISDEFNTSGVSYLGLYRRYGTAGKLIVKSGTKLFIVNRGNVDTTWTDDEYTQLFIITGTVNKGDSASMYLYSDNQNTKFENYAFNSVYLDSTTQTARTIAVSYAVNDTILKLATALPENMTGWTYSVPVAIGDIVSGETFVDSFYLATSTGKLLYNDSTLLGTQTQAAYRDFVDSTLAPGNFFVRYFFNSGMLDGTRQDAMTRATSGNAFLKIALRHKGHATGSILPNKRYFMTLPIDQAVWQTYPTSFSILTQGGAFMYDTALATPIASILEMEVDPTTAFTVRMDSVIVRDEMVKRFVVFVDDSMMAGKDSTLFASGDWFYTFGSSISDDYWGRRNAVVGNYLDDSLRFYGTAPYITTGGWLPDSITTNTPVTFYRRRVISGSSGGYVAGTFWNDRWCLVSDSTPSQIDFSDLFEPMSASGYLVQVNPDDGEPILWLKQMYGTLIIGKNSSIWKLTGVPGVDNFASLSRAIDGLSFVAPKSIVSYNNMMFGLGADGFYVFDFNSMVKISHPIEDLVRDSINWDRTSQIVGGYFDDHFWWSYPSATSIVNDRTVCYNPYSKAWTTATMVFGFTLVDAGVNGFDNVYLGDAETGKVYLYGSDNDDDGTAISASLKTGWFNMGTDWHDKIINRGLLSNHRKTATSLSLSLLSVRPEGVGASVSRSFSGGLSNYRGLTRAFFQADQLRGTQYQLSITATTADSLRIGNVGLEYQVESVGY